MSILLIMAGCTTKRMVKQAHQMEMAGMFKDAAELYYRAALNKPRKIEYRTALRRAATMYAEDVSQKIANSYRQGQYENVVYDYTALTNFTSRIRNVGVEIRIENSVVSMFNNARENYLSERYDQGLDLLGKGRFNEARVIFEEIHKLQPNFRDTRTYLNTATLEPIYQRGTSFFGQGNFMAAYKEWANVAQKDPNYKDVRTRMQQALAERYQEGSVLLMNEDFAAAAIALGEVFRAEPGFMDVRTLFIEARAEPVFRSAVQDLDSGRCRTAYFKFSEILSYATGDYKQSSALAQKALGCASFPIAIHTRNMPSYASDGQEFEKAMIQAILEVNDPFIQLHSLPSVNSRIHRSFLSATGNLNRGQLRELYDRHNMRAVLVINFSDYVREQGKLERDQKTGFERQQIESEATEIAFRERRVTYTEVSQTNRAALNVSIQLIATHNGQVLLSRRFNHREQSEMHYAVYNGEVANLFPALLRNNEWVIDERGQSALKRLLSASNEVESAIVLRDKVFLNLSERIAETVTAFNPER